MFKPNRIAAALALCLMMTLAACTALAAPKLKVSVPSKEVRGASSYVITVTADEPGFLTMNLSLDGVHVSTLADNTEIHTKENAIACTAYTDAGDILVPGKYTVTASMVDQFGVSSSEVTKNITFKLPRDAELVNGVVVYVTSSQESTPTPKPAEAPVTSDTSAKASEASKATVASKATAAPKATATPKPLDIVTYTTGTTVMGEEGYEIGVGVSDSAKTAKGFWALNSSSSDAEIWAAMQEKMVAVNVGENENAYIYDSVKDSRKRLGTISGTSQGLNVITEVGKWSLVEAFRVEDGAFVRGYIRSDKLRVVEPNPTYGIVVDKAAQTLTVYKDGARIGSTPVSTGLPTGKYLHRETPAGEYITVTRRGTIEYYGTNNFCKYTVRVGGSYHLSELPTTKKGGSDFSVLESSLGKKATRGNIVIAHNASTDGGINAEWIWNLTDENKRIKVLILDDKERNSIPVGSK